jgi:hypothetical protein
VALKDIQNLQSLFDPSVARGQQAKQVESYTKLTLSDIDDMNVAPSASFKLDSPGSPLKSTQQVPLDFSKFENHTFFNSAESNVNVAFQRIINEYPFDGTKTEIDAFLQTLTGFEKHVYDRFPKYKNFARFSSTAGPVTVKDFAGTDFPTLSRDQTGRSVLDPVLNSISFEMQFYAPVTAPDKYVILQKLSGSHNGITLTSSGSASTTDQTIQMYISSASMGLSASMIVPKGEWSHIVATFDRDPGAQKIKLYRNAVLQATSSASGEFGEIDFSNSPLHIGSGSTHSSSGFETYTPTQTLSGAIDELRIFHATRSLDAQRSFSTKNIFPTSNLKLYYKFNEVTGTHNGNRVFLDSSGNSLHGSVTTSGIAQSVRGTSGEFSDVTNPMILERLEDNPVLFPGFSTIVSVNSELLTSASQYDANNPNLITRLIPQHYLLEASLNEGFADEDADTGDALYSDTAFPGGARVPSSQIIATLLFMYGKFFDELKIYLDHFSKLDDVRYDNSQGVADTFLTNRAEQLGFNLPSQFTAAKFAQFLLSQNIDSASKLSSESLQVVQNKLWRRILVSLPEIIRSKGTRASVNSILNTLGLEHEKVFRVIEFGGRNVDNIDTSKKTRVTDLKFLDFSGSLAGTNAVDAAGFATTKPVLLSPYLTASKTEPGSPHAKDGINTAASGLLTTASFTVEGIYRFENLTGSNYHVTQSLFRLLGTGSTGKPTVLSNILAHKPNIETGITGTIFAFSGDSQHVQGSSNVNSISLQDLNIFDGNSWHVAFGRKVQSFSSASYFLSAMQVGIQEPRIYRTSINRNVEAAGVFSTPLATHQVSGTFLTIGSQSLETRSGLAQNIGINGDSFATASRGTEFSGKVAQLRFWSKALTPDELLSHARDPDSLGVIDPHTNFCFGSTLTGSWERLRVAATMQQPTTSSDSSGIIDIFDYSQSKPTGSSPFVEAGSNIPATTFNMRGTGFDTTARVIKKTQIRTTQFTPQFDVNASDNKILIEELNDADKANQLGTKSANDRDYLLPQEIDNDNRFLIEVGATQALDEDIMKIFATLEALENAIGSQEFTFGYEYPDVRHLREIYFNRLESKINLTTFFDFFRFFDDTLTTLIQEVLPQNTDFLGVRFIVGPHVLERNKLRHYGENIYLNEQLRDRDPFGDSGTGTSDFLGTVE